MVISPLCTKTGNVPENFMSFNWLCNFYTVRGKFPYNLCFRRRYAIFTGWIFHIFQVTYKKKTGITHQHGMISLVRNNKNPKTTEIPLPQKFHNSDDRMEKKRHSQQFFGWLMFPVSSAGFPWSQKIPQIQKIKPNPDSFRKNSL